MNDTKLCWIRSAGGPLVLLQSSTLPLWKGVRGSDYAEAVAVRGYTGILDMYGKDILVLANEPLETAYHEGSTCRFLVQWSYAPDEDRVVDALSTIDAAAMTPLTEVTLKIVDERQILVDAGAPGADAPERLTLSLPSGTYRVRTFAYRPSEDMELIMHGFLPSTGEKCQ